MKVTLGAVFGKDVDAWYHQSLVETLFRPPPPGYEWANTSVSARSGPLLAMARATILWNFIEHSDGDAIVLIDCDQSFTPERFWDLVSCFRVVKEEQEAHGQPPVGILAGVTWMSGHPKLQSPMPNIFMPGDLHGQLIQAQTYPPDSLLEVGAVGMSNLVLSRELVQHFYDQHINPFHHLSIVNWRVLAEDIAAWDDVDKIEQTMKSAVYNADQLGEDLSFCQRVRDAGYRILCHTGLEFAHSKTFLLDGDDYRKAVAERFPDRPELIGQEPAHDLVDSA